MWFIDVFRLQVNTGISASSGRIVEEISSIKNVVSESPWMTSKEPFGGMKEQFI